MQVSVLLAGAHITTPSFYYRVPQLHNVTGTMLPNSGFPCFPTVRIVRLTVPLAHDVFGNKSPTVTQTLVTQVSIQFDVAKDDFFLLVEECSKLEDLC